MDELTLTVEKKLKTGADVFVQEPFEDIDFLVGFLCGKLKQASEDKPPRVLIFFNEIQSCFDFEDRFKLQGKKMGLRTLVLHDKGKSVEQRIDLFEGVDVVIGNPKRIAEMYFKNGLNLKFVKFVLLFDLTNMLKAGATQHFRRIHESLPKSQKLIFEANPSERVVELLDEFTINLQTI